MGARVSGVDHCGFCSAGTHGSTSITMDGWGCSQAPAAEWAKCGPLGSRGRAELAAQPLSVRQRALSRAIVLIFPLGLKGKLCVVTSIVFSFCGSMV
jgi:hypothetical protein